MRNAALTSALVVLGYAATAQLSLLPQVGFENSKTNITFNDLGSFSPLGVKFSPQVGLRLDYKFKQGHGPWIGLTSSRSQVSYTFNNPEIGMNVYSASVGDMQLRIEAGYQHSFKPIYFNQNNSSTSEKEKQRKVQKVTSVKAPQQITIVRRGCSGKEEVVVVKSHCTQQRSVASNHCGDKSKKVAKKEKGPWIRIQPSLGIGVIPSVPADITSKGQGSQTSYEYKAGNWNTALLAGTGFEFGRNNQRLFTVSINYFKGIGNLDKQSITTISGTKSTTTTFQSEVSGWNMKVGIPFTLAKKPHQRSRSEQKKKECGQDKSEYKSKCSGKIRI